MREFDSERYEVLRDLIIVANERLILMAITQADVLADLAALKAQIDAIPAPTPATDETPVADAVAAIAADVAAKFPPSQPATS